MCVSEIHNTQQEQWASLIDFTMLPIVNLIAGTQCYWLGKKILENVSSNKWIRRFYNVTENNDLEILYKQCCSLTVNLMDQFASELVHELR